MTHTIQYEAQRTRARAVHHNRRRKKKNTTPPLKQNVKNGYLVPINSVCKITKNTKKVHAIRNRDKTRENTHKTHGEYPKQNAQKYVKLHKTRKMHKTHGKYPKQNEQNTLNCTKTRKMHKTHGK